MAKVVNQARNGEIVRKRQLITIDFLVVLLLITDCSSGYNRHEDVEFLSNMRFSLSIGFNLI